MRSFAPGGGHGVVPVLAVTVTTVVGGGLLALPIALAPFGPLVAVLLVVGTGLVSTLAMVGLAAAFARSAATLTATDRLQTVVRQRFGASGATLTVVVNVTYLVLVLVAYGIGIGSTLSSTFGGPAVGWTCGYFAVASGLIVLRLRRVLVLAGTTVIVINFALIAALLGLLAGHVERDLLTAMPVAQWREPEVLAPVFGTLVCVYAGFAGLAGLVAPAMRADPSGRSLVRGVAYAMGISTAIYAVWVVVTLGSTPPSAYLAEGAAGISVMAETAGPSAGLVGTAFVAVAMGMAGLTLSFALADLVVERLPTRRHLEVDFARGVVLEGSTDALTRNSLVITVAPEGDDNGVVARARLGTAAAMEPVTQTAWDSRELQERVGYHARDRWLRLTADTRGEGNWRVEATMAVRLHRTWHSAVLQMGFSDVRFRRILAELVRNPATTSQLVARMGVPAAEVTDALAELAAKGVIECAEDGEWRVHFGFRRHSSTMAARRLVASFDESGQDVAGGWSRFGDRDTGATRKGSRPGAWLSSPVTARLAGVAPVLLTLALIVGLLAAEVSFTTTLALVGIVSVVFLGNILPLMLAISSRHNRDLPGPPGVGLPPDWVLWGVIVLFAGVSAVYALVIYQAPVLRIGAGLAVVVAGLAGWWSWRHGGYRDVAVLALDVAGDGELSVRCLDAGTRVPTIAPKRLPPPGGTLEVVIPGGVRSELRVLTRAGDIPPVGLGDLRMSWPRGHFFGEPPPDIGGIRTPCADSDGPVRIRWEVQ